MAIQAYASEMARAVPGLLFGTNEWVVLTREAGEDIDFGAPLYAGEGGAVVHTNASGTAKFLGVAGSTQCVNGRYVEGDPVNCVAKGMIYVKVAQAVSANGDVFAVKTTGAFRADAGENDTAAVQVPGAVYLEDGAVGDCVPVLLK